MIKRLSVLQLESQLEMGETLPHFILQGSEPYQLNRAKYLILDKLAKLDYEHAITFELNGQTPWDQLYQICHSMSLFSTKTPLILTSENSLNASINQQLNQLLSEPTPDITLLLLLPKLTKSIENQSWYKQLSADLIIVNCNALNPKETTDWIHQQLRRHNLKIDTDGVALLNYYYEGNLLALSQLFEQLELIYQNNPITLSALESQLDDVAIFSPYQWIDAIFLNKPKRAIHILSQLKSSEMEPLILIRSFQKEWIQLIQLIKLSQKTSLKAAFDHYKVWQQKRNSLSPIINRASLLTVYRILDQLMAIELAIKTDYSTTIWNQLQDLTIQALKAVE